MRSLFLQGLDPSHKYFPMVARSEGTSFYGLAPPAVSPNRSQMEETDSQSTRQAGQEPSLSARSSTSIYGYQAPYAESYYSAPSDTSSPPAFGTPFEEGDDDDSVELPIHPRGTTPPPAPSNSVPFTQMGELSKDMLLALGWSNKSTS